MLTTQSKSTAPLQHLITQHNTRVNETNTTGLTNLRQQREGQPLDVKASPWSSQGTRDEYGNERIFLNLSGYKARMLITPQDQRSRFIIAFSP